MNGYYWLFGKEKQGARVEGSRPRDPARALQGTASYISEAPASANGLRSPLVRQTCAVIG